MSDVLKIIKAPDWVSIEVRGERVWSGPISEWSRAIANPVSANDRPIAPIARRAPADALEPASPWSL